MLSQPDATAMMKAVGTVMREHVETVLTPLLQRLDQLEKALADLPVPKDGKDGQDGKSIAVSDVEPLIDQLVTASIAVLPPAKDGKDGTDGKSVTLDDVRPLISSALAEMPKPKDGTDGKSITVDDVLPIVRDWFDSIPRPTNGQDGVDGKSVTMDDVRALHESLFATWQLDWERRAMDLNQRCLDRFEKPKDGKDGTDGLGFDDMTVDYDGRRSFTIRWVRGEQVKEKTFKVPALIEAGVWLHGKSYEQGDGVTCGGSYWIALKDTIERPGDNNSDWRLAVKKGRDGKDTR